MGHISIGSHFHMTPAVVTHWPRVLGRSTFLPMVTGDSHNTQFNHENAKSDHHIYIEICWNPSPCVHVLHVGCRYNFGNKRKPELSMAMEFSGVIGPYNLPIISRPGAYIYYYAARFPGVISKHNTREKT